jgi:1-acyl-sn-glycerol-3-phosphate acyltransferase
MLYSFLRVLVGFTLRIFFQKIYITGTEYVQHSKPQLIASNHPSGFLEPLIMACFFPKPLHFLVRGDVFDNPFLKPLLRGTNQIPVFRFKDGFSRLRENNQSIDESLQVLKNNHNLLIFAEGNTQSIKKLRPLQKGISRIAFQSLEQNPESELEILPVGINFSQFLSFNEVIMLRIGQPVKVSNYITEYNTDKNSGHHKILDDVFCAMKKNVIHLEHQERIHIFEKLSILQNLSHDEKYSPIYSNSSEMLDKAILLAKKTDNLDDEKCQMISEELRVFEKNIKSKGVKFKDLKKKPFNIINLLLLIIGFIPALAGLIFHFVPLAAGYAFMKKNVKALEFKSSILMVADLALLLIYYLILITTIFVLGLPIYIILISFLSGIWLRFYYSSWKTFSFLRTSAFDKINSDAEAILNKL